MELSEFFLMRLQPIKSGATNSAGREKNLVESGLLIIGKIE